MIIIKFVDCHVYDTINRYLSLSWVLNGGVVSSKIIGHFSTATATFFALNICRIIIATWQTTAYRGVAPVQFDTARRCALNGPIIVDFFSALTPSDANVLLLVPTFVSPSRVNPVHNVAADDSVDDNDNGQISRSPRNSNTSMYWRSDGSRNSNADRTRTSQQARWLVWLLSFGALEIATWEKWEVTTGWWKIGHFNRSSFNSSQSLSFRKALEARLT
jgi:hypothetical protein